MNCQPDLPPPFREGPGAPGAGVPWADSCQPSAPPGTASAAENTVQGHAPSWGLRILELTDVGHEGQAISSAPKGRASYRAPDQVGQGCP